MRGKYSPSLEVAFRIANFLCTSIEDVFYYELDIEGEHEFEDGIIVEVSWDGLSYVRCYAVAPNIWIVLV